MRAGLAVAAATAVLTAGCGGGSHPHARSASSAPTAAPVVGRLGAGVSMGVAELNPAILQAPGTDTADDAFRPWSERLTDLRPALYRLVIDWSKLQPTPVVPAQLDQLVDGCSRGVPPCRAYAGMRATLGALGSQQRRTGGFGALVVFHGVPSWAAARPSGCEAAGVESRSRPISDAGMAGYRALVRQVAALARSEGATISWWSPWNEPNGGFFISPQRARCSSSATPVSPVTYARLTRAMRAALATTDRATSRQMVIGELAGVAQASPRGTGSGEFLRALPDDVVCGAVAVAQHSYAHLPGQKSVPGDPVAATEAAMDERPCLRDTPLWITETGVGGIHANEARDHAPAALRLQCRVYARYLAALAATPRVQAIFQYSFREDRAFPVGLVDDALTTAFPTYDLFRAWTHRATPASPSPRLPDSCRG